MLVMFVVWIATAYGVVTDAAIFAAVKSIIMAMKFIAIIAIITTYLPATSAE